MRTKYDWNIFNRSMDSVDPMYQVENCFATTADLDRNGCTYFRRRMNKKVTYRSHGKISHYACVIQIYFYKPCVKTRTIILSVFLNCNNSFEYHVDGFDARYKNKQKQKHPQKSLSNTVFIVKKAPKQHSRDYYAINLT